jgi:phosphatidylglycerol:prolipoprotein diacylglycerol transferase
VHPVLIDLGRFGETDLFLPTYGTLFALAVLLAWWWFMRRARKLGVAEESLFNLTFFSLLAGILGAKLSLILVDWHIYMENPRELLGTIRAAGVLMGGVIAGAVTFVAYSLRHEMPLHRLGDAIAAPLALAQGVGRLGCFSAGCCWGLPAREHNALAVVFTHPRAILPAEFRGVPLVPVQLIEMVFDLTLAAVLSWLWRRRLRPPGAVFWWYVLLYGVGRGLIELWRGDDSRGLYFGDTVSTSQILAVVAILLALIMLIRGRLQLRRTASA